MLYKEIFKLIKDNFEEGDLLNAKKENGRIIVGMKRDRNIWTNEQEKWLNENVVSKVDEILFLLKKHISEDHQK